MWLHLDYILHYGTQWCRAQVPSSEFRHLSASLLCGEPLASSQEQQLFVETGLIHLLIVSGAHLAFLDNWLRLLPRGLRYFGLLTYAWLTGFGLPVLRALLRRCLRDQLRPWGWSGLQVEAAVTLLLLSLHPGWILQASFLMSWLCALALLAPLPKFRWRPLNLASRCYLFLFPFCPTSPVVVAWNCVLGPWILSILLPICALSVVLPMVSRLSDSLWRILLWTLAEGPHAEPLTSRFASQLTLWWLPTLIHILLLWGDLKWRRAVAFLPA